MAWKFDEKPLLVFWETTRACDLACRHCRANAIPLALPGTLNHEEGMALIRQIADFGTPRPILVMTGGDVLKRARLFDLIEYARSFRIPVSVSPSATPLLTEDTIDRLAEAGVVAMSLSLDGAQAESHDALRGVDGTWEQTIRMAGKAVAAGLKVQINTTVMAQNIRELPELFALIQGIGVHIWEVFFLIRTGRGTEMLEPTPEQNESVCHLLYAASHYGVTVRTVEGPFFRRLVAQYEAGVAAPPDALAQSLIADLHARLGGPGNRPRAASAGTRDGKGIVFIGYNGDVSPSGFLPAHRGNVREQTLADIYQNDSLFRSLRQGDALEGACGRCAWREVCAGSRARAHAHSHNPLGEDVACILARPAVAQPV